MIKNSAMHNLNSLNLVANRLGELCNEIVFVGGSIMGLLITDVAAPDIRFTHDVDCIVDIITLTGYHAFAKKVEKKRIQ